MKPRRGLALAAIAAAVLVLAVALLAATMLQPQRLARLVLGAVGDGLGLEIGFAGDARYRLRGTPLLEVRDIVVRRPGESGPLLRAARAMVTLPWSTVRARGSAPLVIERIELDAPVLDVPGAIAWLEARPPGDGAVPTLRDGLHVRDGQVLGEGWDLRDVELHLPRLAPDAPLAASARGVLAPAGSTRLRFDLQLAATRPAPDAGLAARGRVQLERGGWHLPAFVSVSGAPRRAGADWHVPRLRFAVSGTFPGNAAPLRFAMAVQGPLRLRTGTWTLTPAGFALRGDDTLVPTLSGRGRAAFAQELDLSLEGEMPRWPQGWPALPPPLDAQRPTTVDARYRGPLDFSAAPIALGIARGDARASAEGRLPELLAWFDAVAEDSPLPPLRATARVPRVEVAGAVVEGLDIALDPEPAQ